MEKTFEAENLIYYVASGTNRGKWCRPSDCVWTTTTDFDDRLPIKHLYRDLRSLFVDKLNVCEITFKKVYEDLLNGAQSGWSVKEIQQSVLCLNHLLEEEQNPPSSSVLLSMDVFPVRAESVVVLVSAKEDFQILDDSTVAQPGVRYLDIGPRPIHDLARFIAWCNLDDRRTSNQTSSPLYPKFRPRLTPP